MELNLEGEHASRAASVLGALIAPRPIALITTVGADGVVNAAPYSFFNLLGTRPPLLIFAAGDKEDGRQKDTPRNIQLTQEFVVNLVDEGIAKAMNECSAELPYGVSELAQAGL
ncbi:MAG: flavin reductase family protein, partial [Verrucomicrobia bacterium]|nr:flavin reductase family protein [Verrucomicrobiota bacterium]